ncbi:MAG: sialate O-acetylesterase [Fidelibacterota bacterium]|nr:MAG: sialate O-acetylesterase [Candidatus Neomarinimicrobiota bacterium]
MAITGATGSKRLSLYLLMGQSNMSGRGKVQAIDRRTHPRIFMLDAQLRWRPAREPVHFDKPGRCGTGPAMAFARVMAKQDPEAIIGLIPCSVGGSPLEKWQKGVELYKTAIARAELACQSGELAGILWHHGETDSIHEETARTYGTRLYRMISNLRQDLGCPGLVVVVGGLGDFLTDRIERKWLHLVNAALESLPTVVTSTAYVDASGLGPGEDGLHFSAQAARELGRRYAQAMLSLAKISKERIRSASKVGLSI